MICDQCAWTHDHRHESRGVESPICPGCGRVMSAREAAEQGACNDCNGGAW